MSRRLVRTARLAALALAVAAVPAQAQLMRATVRGNIASGFDAYRNSVYFGSSGGYNLTGMAASVSFLYDASIMGGPQGAGLYFDYNHAPNYPSFLGLQGAGAVKSVDFTVNGITLGVDINGPYERNRLYVENPAFSPGFGQRDSWTLTAGDNRFTWCPNDGQCAEAAQLFAYQTYEVTDLFGGQQPFDPARPWSTTASTYRSLGASVRLYQNSVCLPGGLLPTMCPANRFSDLDTHWVEFVIDGTDITVTTADAVPEPATWTLTGFGVLAVAGVARRRRTR